MKKTNEVNEKPKTIEDLTMLDLYSLWHNFLWGLEGTKAWNTIKWSMVKGKKIPDKKLETDYDLTQEGTFLKIDSPEIIKYQLKKEDIDFNENLTPDNLYGSMDENSEILEKVIYEEENKKFKKDPKKWREDYFELGEHHYYKFNIYATCKDTFYGGYVKQVRTQYPNEVNTSLIRALRAEGLEEPWLDNCVFNIKQVYEENYKYFGVTKEDLFINRRLFATDLKPEDNYRFRGLPMSYPHIQLAKALYIRGFMFASEVHVFPQDREDKSYIRPDLLVMHDGKSLIVEVDGPSHDDPIKKLKDNQRDQMFLNAGFKTMRFSADDSVQNPHQCINEIINYLSKI